MANNKNTIFDLEAGFRREHMWIIVSPLVLYFILRVVLPTDLYTTALWLDGLARPTPWGEIALADWPYRILDSLIPINVTVEGMTFSVLLTLTQMMMTLKMLTAGSWVKNGQDPGLFAVIWRVFRHIIGKTTNTIKPENLNGTKFWFFLGWLAVVLFDSYTGLAYRLEGEAAATAAEKVIIGITYAVFYENILSEILLGESIKGILTAVLIVLMALPATRNLTNEWREKWDGSKSKKPPKAEVVDSGNGFASVARPVNQMPNSGRSNGAPNHRPVERHTPPPPQPADDEEVDEMQASLMAAMTGQQNGRQRYNR